MYRDSKGNDPGRKEKERAQKDEDHEKVTLDGSNFWMICGQFLRSDTQVQLQLFSVFSWAQPQTSFKISY